MSRKNEPQRIPEKNHHVITNENFEFISLQNTLPMTSPKSTELLGRYLEENPIGSAICENYNHWIRDVFPEQLKARKFPGKYSNIDGNFYFTTCKYEEWYNEPITPDEAKSTKKTYSVVVKGSLYFQTNDGKSILVGKEGIDLLRIPVPIGAYLDSSRRRKNLLEATKMGGNPYQSIGYFIVDGNEVSVIGKIKLMTDKFLIFKDVNLKTWICQCITSDIIRTSILTFALGVSKKGRTKLDKEKNRYRENSINVSFNKIKPKETIPYFILMEYLFPEKSVDNIIEDIKNHVKKEQMGKVETYIGYSVIHYQQEKIEISKSSNDYRDSLSKYMANRMTSGDPDQNKLRELILSNILHSVEIHNKYNILMMMMVNFLNFLSDQKYPDDRNSWINKKIELASDILQFAFSATWNKVFSDKKSIFDHSTSVSKVFMEVEKNFNKLLKGNPNLKLSGYQGVDEGDVQYINAIDLGSFASIVTKARSGTSHHVKDFNVRAVDPAGIGFMCVIRSPDSEDAGLSEYMASTSKVTKTLNQNQHEIQKNIIRGELIQTDISEDSIPVFYNGILLGYGNSDIRQRLVEMRRRQEIDIFTTVVEEKNFAVRVYTTPGRLVRPLIIVDDGVPRILQAFENAAGEVIDDPYDLSISELIESEIIEFVSPEEVDLHCLIASGIETFEEVKLRPLSREEEQKIQIIKDGLLKYLEKKGVTKQIYSNFVKMSGSNENKLDELQIEQKRIIENLIENFDVIYREVKTKLIPKKERYIKERNKIILGNKISLDKYTHCEIHPGAIVNAVLLTSPNPEHSQTARNVYEANMTSQTMSSYANKDTRFNDPARYIGFMNQRPIVESVGSEAIGMVKAPTGSMVEMAIKIDDQNQEDAIILNQTSADMGFGAVMKYHSVSVSIIPSEGESFRVPDLNRGFIQNPEIWHAIDVNTGFARVGSHIREGDVIVAKIKNIGPRIEDISHKAKMGEHGIVDAVITNKATSEVRSVTIVLRQFTSISNGDKGESRYAQKNTQYICPEVDLPFIPSSLGKGLVTKRVPDLILNPHAIPSRMTAGLLLEIVASTGGIMNGERLNGTIFDEFDIEGIKRKLIHMGISPKLKMQFIDGRTGKSVKSLIFSGKIYYRPLKHRADDKFQGRGDIGPIDRYHRNPIKSKSRGGGLKTGEMEHRALMTAGSYSVIKSKYIHDAAEVQVLFCKCGRPSYLRVDTEAESQVICQYCKKQTDVRLITLPYATMLVYYHLLSIGVEMTFMRGD